MLPCVCLHSYSVAPPPTPTCSLPAAAAVGHLKQAVILTVRGTHGTRDLLTNVCGSAAPLPGGGGGHAHFGMLRAAELLLRREGERLGALLGGHPGYALRLVGHSMGGGVAALAALLLRRAAAEGRPLLGGDAGAAGAAGAVAAVFAPPCSMSAAAADECAAYVTAVVNAHDAVPRFSTHNVEALRQEMLAIDWRTSLRLDLARSEAARGASAALEAAAAAASRAGAAAAPALGSLASLASAREAETARRRVTAWLREAAAVLGPLADSAAPAGHEAAAAASAAAARAAAVAEAAGKALLARLPSLLPHGTSANPPAEASSSGGGKGGGGRGGGGDVKEGLAVTAAAAAAAAAAGAAPSPSLHPPGRLFYLKRREEGGEGGGGGRGAGGYELVAATARPARIVLRHRMLSDHRCGAYRAALVEAAGLAPDAAKLPPPPSLRAPAV